MKVCKTCEQRKAALGADQCLGCISSGGNASRPTQNQHDRKTSCTLARWGMTCERCGAPALPVNTFTGGGKYSCSNPGCLHVSKTAMEAPR